MLILYIINEVNAAMAKLVDAGDSKSPGANHAGSSPASGTNIISNNLFGRFFYFIPKLKV